MADTHHLTPLLPHSDGQAAQWRAEASAILPHCDEAASLDLMAAIFAHAPHLHHLAKLFSDDIDEALQGRYQTILDQATDEFTAIMQQARMDDEVFGALRRYRTRCYHILALSELAGHLDIQTQMHLLSSIADRAVAYLADYLCRSFSIDRHSLLILALGKLGAEELNYSSDIDLIFFFDAEAAQHDQHMYVKLTRRFIELMQKQTKDGFAWRVDLRLRPDPGATAICLSVQAAITYYESIARSWERAVYLRARPIAGNVMLGEMFLKAINPFIWRRQLDYSLIEDLTSWITHKPLSDTGFSFDVKRGAFAIRHIEMTTHILQLLHGGRDKNLRHHSTFKALTSLQEAGFLQAPQADEISHCYNEWRRLEHRLQYCRDAHIYALPSNQEELFYFARFMGFEDDDNLLIYLRALQNRTKKQAYHPIIKDMINAHLARDNADIEAQRWPADDHSQQQFLKALGFQRETDIIRTIESWMSGRLAATRTERARQYLDRLLPLLLEELAKDGDADQQFMGFVEMVEALPSGVQFFALLAQHPSLIKLISRLASHAPSLMRELARHPSIFEQMLDDTFFAPLELHADFDGRFKDAAMSDDIETALDELRRHAFEARFRAQMHIITIPEQANSSAPYLSSLSDSALRASLHLVSREFEKAHGIIKNSDYEIILLGRAGERRLTPQSDIDIIFIYEGDRGAESDGKRPLSTTHYYQRFAQRLMSWTSAQTAHGQLLQLDARLRPDGSAGPLATHIDSFDEYLIEKAWPFEILALRKSRLLLNESKLSSKLAGIISDRLTSPLDKMALLNDVKLMRAKLANSQPARWDFKKQRGGLLDCEFITALHSHFEIEAHLIELAADLTDKLNQISIFKAVYMPKNNAADMPAALQNQIAHLCEQTSFDSALGHLLTQMDKLASALDDLSARLNTSTDK